MNSLIDNRQGVAEGIEGVGFRGGHAIVWLGIGIMYIKVGGVTMWRDEGMQLPQSGECFFAGMSQW